MGNPSASMFPQIDKPKNAEERILHGTVPCLRVQSLQGHVTFDVPQLVKTFFFFSDFRLKCDMSHVKLLDSGVFVPHVAAFLHSMQLFHI